MRRIGTYPTLHDFWTDLNETLSASELTPVRGNRNRQQELRAYSNIGNLAARVVLRQNYGPSCLRVSSGRPYDISKNTVTKLDLMPTFIDDSEVWRHVGHLVVSGGPNQSDEGLYIVSPQSIPTPQQYQLDSGLRALGFLGSIP